MNEISFVRGDTHVLAIDTLDENGAVYTPAVGDVLTMTVRALSDETTVALSKTSGDGDVVGVTGGWQITLQPADTSALAYGRYVYDVEVTLADGYVQTIIPYADLTLTREVTYVSPAP